MKLLITAFEPFAGESVNPSMLILDALSDTIGEITLVKAVLPVTFAGSGPLLTQLIDQHQPDFVISLGQAGSRSHITVEKIAINFDHARIPDNDGEQRLNACIASDHHDGYFSTLPVNAMVNAMTAASIPATLSYSAGTFVCNHVMFTALAHIRQNNYRTRSGFIHIPFLPEQTLDKPQTASMSLADMIKGITAAIEALYRLSDDPADCRTGTTC